MFDNQKPNFRIALALAVLLLLLGGLWAAATFLWPQDDGKIAILKAETDAFKVKPEQAGGMQIPHQDKLVFNTVSNEGKGGMVERVLPAPEQPVLENNQPKAPLPNAIQEAAALTQAQITQAQGTEKEPSPAPVLDVPSMVVPEANAAAPEVIAPQPEQAATPVVTPVVTPTASASAATLDTVKDIAPSKKAETTEPKKPAAIKKAVVKAITQAAVKPPLKKAPETEPNPPNTTETAQKKPSSATSSTKVRFQIASFFDKALAEKSLPQLKQKYANDLQGAGLFITAAKINGDKNVFRIQGNATNVSTICSGIKAKGGACVSIRP
jgi:hypothetical protein